MTTTDRSILSFVSTLDSNLQTLFIALFARHGGRRGLPYLLLGDPGIGKSAIIEGLAEVLALPCETLAPGERGEGAFGAVPVPVHRDGMTVISYPAPEWVSKMHAGGVVFVDEVTTAPPSLQPALLGLVHARRIGGQQLNPHVRVLGAANAPEAAADGTNLAPALANRFGWKAFQKPTAQAVSRFLTEGRRSAPPSVRYTAKEIDAVLDEHWGREESIAASHIAAFLSARPELLHKMPPASDPRASGAWPSPRTWDYATSALAAARIFGLDVSEQVDHVAAFVGEGASAEFAGFLGTETLPSPEDVLDTGWTPDIKRLDVLRAVLLSAATFVVNDKSDKAEAREKKFWSICAAIIDRATDLVAHPANAVLKGRYSGANNFPSDPNGRAVVSKMAAASRRLSGGAK